MNVQTRARFLFISYDVQPANASGLQGITDIMTVQLREAIWKKHARTSTPHTHASLKYHFGHLSQTNGLGLGELGYNRVNRLGARGHISRVQMSGWYCSGGRADVCGRFTVKTSHCQNVPSSKRPKVITSPVKTSLHGQNVPSQIVPILR